MASTHPGQCLANVAVTAIGPAVMAKIETPQPVRGTQSLLGEDADRFHAVIAAFDRVRRLYGFKRVEVPVIEPTAVFARSLGRDDRRRVEGNVFVRGPQRRFDHAPARIHRRNRARLSVAKAGSNSRRLKIATHGPAFRYERPQKGRFRQFHQLDAEIIGAAEPAADVEIIALGSQLLAELGIEGVDAQAQHAGRCRQPRGMAREACRAFRSASRRFVARQPGTAWSKTRCASSTARTRATASPPTARRR